MNDDQDPTTTRENGTNWAHDPDSDTVIDLRHGPNGYGLMYLDCGRCGEWTEPVQLMDDPGTVVRCARCGKKHSTESMGIPPEAGA